MVVFGPVTPVAFPLGLTPVVVFGVVAGDVVVVVVDVVPVWGEVPGVGLVLVPVTCPGVVPVVPAPVVLRAAAMPAQNSKATARIMQRVRILAPENICPSQA